MRDEMGIGWRSPIIVIARGSPHTRKSTTGWKNLARVILAHLLQSRQDGNDGKVVISALL